MDTPLFAVLNSNELDALLEAKFRPAIPDTDLPSSSFVITMIERAVEAKRNLAIASDNKTVLSNLETWQRAEENPIYLAAARERLKECPKNVWLKWSKEERLKFAQQILSPFRAEQPLLEELLNEMPLA